MMLSSRFLLADASNLFDSHWLGQTRDGHWRAQDSKKISWQGEQYKISAQLANSSQSLLQKKPVGVIWIV